MTNYFFITRIGKYGKFILGVVVASDMDEAFDMIETKYPRSCDTQIRVIKDTKGIQCESEIGVM